MDLSVQRPPLLYRGAGRPPSDAWDLQVAAPSPLAAWLHERRQAGRPCGVYTVGAQRAITTIATTLPEVPMRSEHHFDSPRFPHPHVHVLLAAHDADGRPLVRDQLQQIAVDAWIAHVDRMIGYARERPHLGLAWTHDGVNARHDQATTPTFVCTAFDRLQQNPVIGHP